LARRRETGETGGWRRERLETGDRRLETGGRVMGTGVVEVAEADAHVAGDGVGHGDGEAHTEDAVGEGQRIEVAIAEEERAGDGSPYYGERDEDWIRDVGGGEEDRGQRDSWIPQNAEAEEAREDVDLQDELLHQRPERVSQQVCDDGQRSVEGMQGVQVNREGDAGERDQDGGGDDPKRGEQAAQAETVGFDLSAAEDGSEGDPREGDPVEDALGGVGGPEGGEDEGVADGEFEEVAGAG
jgi:hypothetical protein